MSRQAAFAEDLCKLGVALLIAAMVGGLLQDAVAGGVAIVTGVIGVAVWMSGLPLTSTKEAI